MKASKRPSRGAAARIAAGDRAMGARIVQSAIGRPPRRGALEFVVEGDGVGGFECAVVAGAKAGGGVVVADARGFCPVG